MFYFIICLQSIFSSSAPIPANNHHHTIDTHKKNKNTKKKNIYICALVLTKKKALNFTHKYKHTYTHNRRIKWGIFFLHLNGRT